MSNFSYTKYKINEKYKLVSDTDNAKDLECRSGSFGISLEQLIEFLQPILQKAKVEGKQAMVGGLYSFEVSVFSEKDYEDDLVNQAKAKMKDAERAAGYLREVYEAAKDRRKRLDITSASPTEAA